MQLDFNHVNAELKQASDKTPTQLYHLYYIKAVHFTQNEQYNKALLYFEKAIALKINHGKKAKKHVILLYTYSIAASGANQNEQSLNSLLQADSILQTKFDAFALSMIRYSIMEEFRMKSQLKEALSWAIDAEKIYKKNGLQVPDMILISKASVYNQLGDQSQNKEYYRKALRITDELIKRNDIYQNPTHKTRILSEKGVSLSNLNQPAEAISIFLQAKAIDLSNGNYESATNTSINIFYEQVKLKNYPEVIRSGNNLILECKKYNLTNRIHELYLQLAKAYEKTGNFKASNEMLYLYADSHEKMLKEQYSTDLNKLTIQYQTQQKDQSIKQLEEEKKHEAQRSKTKQQQLTLTILGLVIVALLLFVAIVTTVKFNLARKRIAEQAQSLSIQNTKLDSEVKQKNFLFRELHHRVKNNFQLVISFLQLQQNASGNEASEAFIQGIELKMNAMSMVHEMLYKDGNNETINIKEYLDELSNSVLDALAETNIDAEFEISGDNASLNIEKAISVGLVINELITNSIKHAGVNELLLKIEIQETDESIILQFSDNGVGFPSQFDPNINTTLGTRAIVLLMRQIHAKMNWKNRNGAVWLFSIPKKV